MKNRSELINFNYLAQGKLSEDEMPTYVADSTIMEIIYVDFL